MPVIAVLPDRQYLTQFVLHTFLICYQSINHTEWMGLVNKMVSLQGIQSAISLQAVSLEFSEEVSKVLFECVYVVNIYKVHATADEWVSAQKSSKRHKGRIFLVFMSVIFFFISCIYSPLAIL